jgi:hypothetical protein
VDDWGISETLHGLGALAADRGEFGGATRFLHESLVLRRRLGKEFGSAQTLYFLGLVAFLNATMKKPAPR